MDKVLVTGGSGFIALHCIDQLLEKGYVVRTTVRSESRIDEIKRAMNQFHNLGQNLELRTWLIFSQMQGQLKHP